MTRISEHARKKIRKRVGTKDVEGLFGSALMNGVKRSDTKGRLRKYLDKNCIIHSSDATIYQGYIFWHNKTNLITVYALPSQYRKYIK